MSQGFNDSSVHVSTVLNNVGTDGTGYRSFDTDSAAQGTQPFDMQSFLASSGTVTVQTQEQDPLAGIPLPMVKVSISRRSSGCRMTLR